MDNEIDLGQTNDERYGALSGPVASDKDDKKHYPSFMYSGPKSLDLPEDGKMTIEFCVMSETESRRDGKDHYECVIEVRKICDVEDDDESGDHDEKPPAKVSDILDSLMKKHMEENKDKY